MVTTLTQAKSIRKPWTWWNHCTAKNTRFVKIYELAIKKTYRHLFE